jgi:hypothetical protein
MSLSNCDEPLTNCTAEELIAQLSTPLPLTSQVLMVENKLFFFVSDVGQNKMNSCQHLASIFQYLGIQTRA